MSYRPVTIEEAKEIALSHELDQLVIWHFSDRKGQHVTTWGTPVKHSLLAAEAGNHVKRAAGWHPDNIGAMPRPLSDIFGEVDAAARVQIDSGHLQKEQVLAVFRLIREAFGKRDPELAKRIAPRECEAAKGGA